jgi:hypothetical protein
MRPRFVVCLQQHRVRAAGRVPGLPTVMGHSPGRVL